MEKYTGDNSILSISSNKIKSCRDVAEKLVKMRVLSQVKTNDTIACENGNYYIEKGCSILLPGLNKKLINTKVWQPLKEEYGLHCAHLKVNDRYNGCVNDYIRKSDCPTTDDL